MKYDDINIQCCNCDKIILYYEAEASASYILTDANYFEQLGGYCKDCVDLPNKRERVIRYELY